MAEKTSISSFIFCFLLLFFLGPVLCRNTPESTPANSKITSLDVSTSLQQTQKFISFEEDAVEEETLAEPISASSFTIRLHSRDSLKKPTSHGDYKNLTLARLSRDAARVKSLNTRLDLALKNIDRADLKPINAEDSVSKAEELTSPVISGTSQGSGEYFSRVGIGRPAKPLYVVLDTGSDVTWVQCEPCTDCYQQADPVFQPSSSSSYSQLFCESEQCKSLDDSSCRNGSCLYQVDYGDGSYTVGDFVKESLTFGTGAESNSVDNIALGCGHDNEGLFVGAAGLLGLGAGKLSFPSQVSAASFSYCLVNRDSKTASTLQFGSDGANPAVTASLLRNQKLDTFYYVDVTGMSVGGQILSIPASAFALDESGNGGVIIDSGTAVSRLQTDAYDALRDAFVAGTRHLRSASGVALFDTCYDLSSSSAVDVPTVAFRFGDGKSLQLPATNYLIPVDSSGTFCFAFAPTSSSLSIIGNVQQQGTRVSFNKANSLVGFSPNKC